MFLPLAFLENLGFGELCIVMIIALLLFGERLPNVARSFGKGLSEFKRSMRDSTDQVRREFEAAAGPITEPMKEFRQQLNEAAADMTKAADTLPNTFNENKLDPSIQNCEETPPAPAAPEKLPAHGEPAVQPPTAGVTPDATAGPSAPVPPSPESSAEATPAASVPVASVPSQSCAPAAPVPTEAPKS
ncbi:MAG: twin-arginine translocase TatA/TatE family subunit [Planctomycetes bacterium]|nr:twin-arginine translocase TatA/TatE family subunit [Planctomycetota bacterium]